MHRWGFYLGFEFLLDWSLSSASQCMREVRSAVLRTLLDTEHIISSSKCGRHHAHMIILGGNRSTFLLLYYW